MKNSTVEEIIKPYFFKPNRVWRLYKGGKLLDRFKNLETENDGHFPEEWLASTVKAYNGIHMQSENEGIAKIDNDKLDFLYFSELLDSYAETILGKKHYDKYGNNIAILCKYLDSAVRLPIQCHPDKEMAKKYYKSDFGKTECWHIISTRSIDGINPYILLGFKKNIIKEHFIKAIKEQDFDTVIEMLHKIEVKEGETYFVPARMPHAIGPGVFMLEVQEPSDWVIQPEQKCSDLELSHEDMWGPLIPEVGMEIFDYTGYTKEELILKVSPSNKLLKDSESLNITELIGHKHTDSFKLWEATIKGKTELNTPNFAIIIVLKGEGFLTCNNEKHFIKKSDYFFIPNSLKNILFQTKDSIEILICMPPDT